MKKIVLAGLVLLACACGWYRLALRPVSAEQARVNVEIPRGLSLSEIARKLQEEGVIRSSWAFFIFAELHRSGGGLQAGSFFLRPSMSVSEIVTALRRGYSEEMTIIIPEGYTLKDIDALVAAKQLGKPGDLLACAKTCDFSSFDFLPSGGAFAPRATRLEGYLFPDTYFVVRDTYDAQSFLERLLTTFRERVVRTFPADAGRSGRSLHQIVTMASLIEAETRGADERPTVAGILWKRLDQQTALGVDAAVRYIVGKPTGALTAADLAVQSPYNLRKFKGLPPGPIGNPGRGAIDAALHPKDSPYLYYLHDANGEIHYAETNDQHNANRAKYLP